MVGWYGALGCGIVIDEPAQSVRMPPGSRTVIFTPNRGELVGKAAGEPGYGPLGRLVGGQTRGGEASLSPISARLSGARLAW